MIIPTIISLTNVISTTSNTIKKQAVQSEVYTTQLAYTYLSQKVDEVIQIMNFIQFDAEILYTLNQGLHEDIPPRAFLNINKSLDHLTRNSNVSVNIVPLNHEHGFTNQGFTSKLDQKELKIKGHTHLEEESSFGVYWFSDKDFPSDEEQMILGRKIVNYTGHTIAYVYAGINGEVIDKVLSKSESQTRRKFFVLDANHDMIYGAHDFSIDDTNWLKEGNNEDSDTFFHTFNGLNYLVVQKPFISSDWLLVSYTPYDDIAQELGDTFQSHILIQVLSFSILIISLLYVVNMYTRPINHLAFAANEINKGNLHSRSNIKRKDEIGKLSVAFDSMLDRIQTMIKQITKEKNLKVKAEISYLHAKIKPHFIYNVLNTIRLQAMKNGDTESSKSIYMFTQFLRSVYTVNETITLRQELDHTIHYLNLVNKMRKFPIALKIEADDKTLLKSVPSFFLQPIVENAVNHGDLKEFGEISITTKIIHNRIAITIKDDGVGVKDGLDNIKAHLSLIKSDIFQQDQQEQYGIGLSNIYRRMKISFGSEFIMNVDNGAENGFVVQLNFPLESCK